MSELDLNSQLPELTRSGATKQFWEAIALTAGEKAGIKSASDKLKEILETYPPELEQDIRDKLRLMVDKFDAGRRGELVHKAKKGTKRLLRKALAGYDAGHIDGHAMVERGILNPYGGKANVLTNLEPQNSHQNRTVRGRRIEQEFVKVFDSELKKGKSQSIALNAAKEHVIELAKKRSKAFPLPDPGSVFPKRIREKSPVADAYNRVLERESRNRKDVNLKSPAVRKARKAAKRVSDQRRSKPISIMPIPDSPTIAAPIGGSDQPGEKSFSSSVRDEKQTGISTNTPMEDIRSVGPANRAGGASKAKFLKFSKKTVHLFKFGLRTLGGVLEVAGPILELTGGLSLAFEDSPLKHYVDKAKSIKSKLDKKHNSLKLYLEQLEAELPVSYGLVVQQKIDLPKFVLEIIDIQQRLLSERAKLIKMLTSIGNSIYEVNSKIKFAEGILDTGVDFGGTGAQAVIILKGGDNNTGLYAIRSNLSDSYKVLQKIIALINQWDNDLDDWINFYIDIVREQAK